ncbi:MAG: hypothetical protein F6K50_50985 [Moorea sp. SIO3I7]|nr:hypothetical protein [Moorena sp. SIO3I7]NEO50186.1 hypothetical protein [Moorena sp. SIO4A3]
MRQNRLKKTFLLWNKPFFWFRSFTSVGNYHPVEFLSAFDGLSAAGSWQLIIKDNAAGDSGSLGSWSLDLGYTQSI